MDTRIEKRIDTVCLQLEKNYISSIHRCCENRSDEVGFYRLLQNKKVSESYLINRLSQHLEQSTSGCNILALCDTTEYNFSTKSKRLKKKRGLGSTTNNDCLGFFNHSILAVDERSKAPKG